MFITLYTYHFASVLRVRMFLQNFWWKVMWLFLIHWSKISFVCFWRLAAEDTNGIDNHVPTNTVVQNSCCSSVINGDSTPSPSQAAARPKNTPAPKPLTSELTMTLVSMGTYDILFKWKLNLPICTYTFLIVIIFLNLQFCKRNLKIIPPEFFFFHNFEFS